MKIVLEHVPDEVGHAIEDTARMLTQTNLKRGGRAITVEALVVAHLCTDFCDSYHGPERTLEILGA